MEAMQFAIPFVKVASNPTGNLDDIPPTVSPCPTSTQNTEEIPNTQEGDEDLTEDLLDQPGPSPRHLYRHGRGTEVEPHCCLYLLEQGVEAERAFSEYFSAKKEKLSTLHPSTDERDKREEGIKNFVLSLIPDLMHLNDVQLRCFKWKALLLIDEVSSVSSTIVADPHPTPQSAVSGSVISQLNRTEQSTR
nr:unnamed protein product [Callosobruchus analis]